MANNTTATRQERGSVFMRTMGPQARWDFERPFHIAASYPRMSDYRGRGRLRGGLGGRAAWRAWGWVEAASWAGIVARTHGAPRGCLSQTEKGKSPGPMARTPKAPSPSSSPAPTTTPIWTPTAHARADREERPYVHGSQHTDGGGPASRVAEASATTACSARLATVPPARLDPGVLPGDGRLGFLPIRHGVHQRGHLRTCGRPREMCCSGYTCNDGCCSNGRCLAPSACPSPIPSPRRPNS